MKSENKINPMICLIVNKIVAYAQKDYMFYYKIFMPGALMAATQLHAFKVIRNGEELYLPTFMLKKNDLIWIDQSAFMADGSLILTDKHKINKKCLPENTKVLVPIENIVVTEENIIHFHIASITIQSSNNHPFTIMRKGQRKTLEACKIEKGDLFEIDISLLTPGNKVFGSNGKCHVIMDTTIRKKEY